VLRASRRRTSLRACHVLVSHYDTSWRQAGCGGASAATPYCCMEMMQWHMQIRKVACRLLDFEHSAQAWYLRLYHRRTRA